jgi:hypothetical protein
MVHGPVMFSVAALDRLRLPQTAETTMDLFCMLPSLSGAGFRSGQIPGGCPSPRHKPAAMPELDDYVLILLDYVCAQDGQGRLPGPLELGICPKLTCENT